MFQLYKHVYIIGCSLLCLIFSLQANSATVVISGHAPEYAKNQIELLTLHDFVSEEKISLGTLNFDPAGKFRLQVDLQETSLVFAEFDGYHGMIYLEPGKVYELAFPPKRTLTESQKRNPFAKPEQVWFGILNPAADDLNIRIQKFDQSYYLLENKYFTPIFINQSKSLVDTIKTALDNAFPKTGSKLFEYHKQFRKASLEFALHQGKASGFMESYFSEIKPQYQLATYASLFNQVFINYFNTLTTSAKTAHLNRAIQNAGLQQLDEYFQKELHFNRELSHLILLKCLKDAYYSNQYPKASILKMLTQVKSLGWSNFEIQVADRIKTKLTYLTSGTNPPQIILKNQNGQRVNLSDFANTYIYLHFTDPANPVCRQHLDALKTVATHYRDKLTIIHVVKNLNSFRNENGWPGIFTSTTTNIDETFKVKTFPTAYLIGKDGKLLLSPAPNPIDGLDRQMGQILKSDHIREMQKRNQ